MIINDRQHKWMRSTTTGWPHLICCCFFIMLTTGCINEAIVSPGQMTDLLHGKESYHSPLGHPLHVTGTVGEFRGSHYHYGLDISTYDALGRPVYAVRKGSVIRLMYRRYGIGYGLWVQHDDGLVSLYGHLREFSADIRQHPALANYREAMEERREFVASLHPETIAVERGQYIAHSGDTGIGPHHLHFELQDKRTRINPLLHGMPYVDREVPIMQYAMVHPASPVARINGQRQPVKIELILDQQNGNLHIYKPKTKQKIRIAGSVRLQLAAYDPSGRSRLGLAAGELRVNGRERFAFAFERLPRLPPNHQFVLYDREHTRLRGGARYLYNFHEIYKDFLPMARAHNSGLVRAYEMKAGLPVELSIMDAVGHKAALELNLEYDPQNYPPIQSLQQSPAAHAIEVERGETAVLRSKDENFEVSIREETIFEKEHLFIHADIRQARLPRGLKQLSAVYALQPAGKPMAAPFSASIKGPPGERINVYRFHGRSVKSLGQRALYSEGRWRFQDYYSGNYVLLEDRMAPRWLRPRLKITPAFMIPGKQDKSQPAVAQAESLNSTNQKQSGKARAQSDKTRDLGNARQEPLTDPPEKNEKEKNWRKHAANLADPNAVWPTLPPFRLFLYATDIGSGVDYDSLNVTVDGKPALVEHDGDHRRVEIFAPADLIYKPGIHTVVARVKDHAGNAARVLKFRYAAGKRARVLR